MLRRARELDDYAIGATDGEVGRVRDMRLDDRRWMVRALVVDAGGLVLISPLDIARVDAKQRALCARLTSAQVTGAAPLDTDKSARSAREFTAHYVQGLDAEIGRLADILFDDRTWEITHLVVAAETAAPRRRMVLVPVRWVSWVSWDTRAVVVGLRSDKVAGAPEYDGTTPLGPEDEARIAAYYGRPPFGSAEDR